MRKKYIFINTLILFSSLILFLLISIYVVSSLNERNTNTSIKNYLSIVESVYDGKNMKEVADEIHASNNNVRITFISSDGMVLYDTSKTSEENHLDRPEIKNIGSISKRYSDTTNVRMYYVASFNQKNNVYVRVSIPEASVSDVVNRFTYYGITGIIILSIISFGFIYLTSKKLVKPLKEEISKLSKITNTELVYDGDNLVELSSQIESVRKIIDSNMQSIKSESNKLNYIIENMNSGVIIIAGDGNVMLVNSLALKVLDRKREDLENKSYLYSFVDLKISDEIERAMMENVNYETTYKSKDEYYSIAVSSLYADFVMVDNKSGVAIFIHDITEAKKLESVKLDFFANASHELKSPLTSIIGYQELIGEGIITDEADIKDATNKTVKEASRMNQIIIEMLELSKLEMDTIVEKKELSLSGAIDGVLESFDVLIKNKNITIGKKYNDFTVNMNMDELYHVIRNLIDNAIKYNKENGSISIVIDKKNKTLSISDTGIGISKEHLNRIFERFYRVDKAKSKELGGTGLGLAIVKHICMNNDITIDVKSNVGDGTEFILKFKP